MIASGDRARSALVLANGEVLREGAGARDRRLVVTRVGANLVSASIRLESAKALSSAARVVITVVLDDIVLGLRRVDPAVDREVRAR